MTDSSFSIGWPLGPEYNEWVDSPADTGRAWTLYKLAAAGWYIELLQAVGEQHGYRRIVGVEMALDGATAHLSSAFDAATAAIIVSAEARLRVAASNGAAALSAPLPEHLYKWEKAQSYLEDPAVIQGDEVAREMASSTGAVVSSALSRDPVGWLASLRDLRNRATHRNTLARNIHVEVWPTDSSTDWQLTVAGHGVDPIEYLRASLAQLTQLVQDHMLPIVERLSGGTIVSPNNTTKSATLHAPTATTVAIAGTARAYSTSPDGLSDQTERSRRGLL